MAASVKAGYPKRFFSNVSTDKVSRDIALQESVV